SALDGDEIGLLAPGSDLHIKHKLAMTRDQVKEAAVRETEYAVAHGVDVSFVTEDTFRADLDFVVELYDACTAAGAHRAVVCDTVGVMTPPGIAWFFGQLKRRLKPTELSFHGHNRSEEHTSELQSPDHLVCRLLLEKKTKTNTT